MRRNQIKMVFQDPGGSFNPAHSILWSLHEELLSAGIHFKDERERRIGALLPKVGLDRACCGRYPHQLSGGQKQRAAILCALLSNPKLLIADEVVSALDLSVQAQILNLLMQLQKDTGISCLFISHDLGVVYHVSDRIAVMYRGVIVEYGSAEQVFRSHTHPYTKLLFSSLSGVDTSTEREEIRETDAAGAVLGSCRFASRCPHRIPACTSSAIPLIQAGPGHFVLCLRADRDGQQV